MANSIRTRRAISQQYLEGRFTPRQMSMLRKGAFATIRNRYGNSLSRTGALWSIANARRVVGQHGVAISADHNGWKAARLAKAILDTLQVQTTRDFGPDEALLKAVPELDYPTMITPAIETLGDETCSRVILCTGRGADAAIHAGKMGATAVKAVWPVDVISGRQHGNATVLTFGEELIAKGTITPAMMARSLVLFLSVPFVENGGRTMQQTAAIRRLVQARERMPEGDVAWETPLRFRSVVDPSEELAAELSKEPSLADILFIKAREALLRGDAILAKHLIERYIKEGCQQGEKSPNYDYFLRYFVSLLKGNQLMRKVDAEELRGKIKPAVA